MSTWRGFSDVEINEAKQSNREISQKAKQPKRLVNKTIRLHVDNDEEQKNTPGVGSSLPGLDHNPAGMSSLQEPDEVNQPPVNNEEEQTIMSFNSTSKKTLDELYDQQRVIEEENKKRKRFLERAIEERYKHSIQENNTLIQVKQELLKLDNLVTRDISILRAKIEEANRMYTQAKKRFEEAEKEYLASKLCLFEAKENKELLSEHLYTIIQHNEHRKSKKLEELMSALEIDGKEILLAENSSPFLTTNDRSSPPLSNPLGSSVIHRMD